MGFRRIFKGCTKFDSFFVVHRRFINYKTGHAAFRSSTNASTSKHIYFVIPLTLSFSAPLFSCRCLIYTPLLTPQQAGRERSDQLNLARAIKTFSKQQHGGSGHHAPWQNATGRGHSRRHGPQHTSR